MTYEIEFKDVSFQYEEAKTYALSGLNFGIMAGEIVLLTGPSGSGKTTLCSCINGLVPHYHEGNLTGQVLVRGYDTKRSRIGGLSSIVGLVFQDPERQIVTATVADEVAFGPENLGFARLEIEQRVAQALQAMRLEGYDERDPNDLSGGEQQATVIAAIYAMHPEIYVMDEPLANLDPAGRAQVIKLVTAVAKEHGRTLLLVEHALDEVLPLVDRVMVMDRGKIVRDGSVAEVLTAGDIPSVFSRPSLSKLAEKFNLDPTSLDPAQFYKNLAERYPMGKLKKGNFDLPSSDTGAPIIEIENVSFSFNAERDALENVNLTFSAGDLVAILGRNGSGKTTLVRHIIGLLQPDSGRVTVNGKDVAHTPTYELAQQVGFCFQNPNHQLVAFNVRDEMAFGMKAHDYEKTMIEERTLQALEFVGLQEYLEAEIFDMGKGQKQRLAIASVIALQPEILIIDEPTTGQDPRMAIEIFDILRRLNQDGTTVLLITHKIDLAAAYAHRAVVMKEGQVDFDGPIQELLMDKEKIRANSLALPDTTRLASLLAAHGVPEWLSTYAQLETAITELVEAAHDD